MRIGPVFAPPSRVPTSFAFLSGDTHQQTNPVPPRPNLSKMRQVLLAYMRAYGQNMRADQ